MPDVLFVCVHNSGRSQMARAFFNEIAKQRGLSVEADSAGTSPSASVNPLAAQAMTEVGLSIPDARPKHLTAEMATSAGRLITMGCGVEAEACPAGTYFAEDWGLEDPAGQPIEKVREIRDQVRTRVERLLDELFAPDQAS